MTFPALLESPVGADVLRSHPFSGLSSTVPARDSLRDVLAWVKADGNAQELIDRVAGVTDTQSAYLSRLSALVVTCLDQSEAPRELLDALNPACGVAIPIDVGAAFRNLLAVDPITTLAALYAETVAAANRRTLGTFFTPRGEATTMVREYALRFSPPARVVDIGAGVGVFSDAARTQWPATVVDAIDINPVTLGLQAAALGAIDRGGTFLFLDDFANWIARFTPDGPVLYLGNPPYTRWQLIPAADRARLLEAADGLVDARSNLSTIFLAITLKKLRPQDGLSLIVPASWMEARYAKNLRKFVREQRRRPVTLRLADSWRFENAIVDAVVVEIGPEQSSTQPLQIADWPGVTVIEQTRTDGDQTPFPRLSQHRVDHGPGARRIHDRLGDIARITRGVATGSNSFFVFTTEDAIDKDIAVRWSIPLARRLRIGASSDAPVVERALLLALDGYRPGDDHVIDALVADGENRGVDQAHLCAQRRRWFDLTAEIKRPDVILTSLGRETFHFHDNLEGLAITNNLFGLRWRDGVDDTQKKHALNWLRSEDGQQALIRSSATEANGLHRLSPRAIEDLRFPREEPQRAAQRKRVATDMAGDGNASC